MNKTLISTVREKLIKNADDKTRASFQRFFKEEVKFHGTRTAIVSKIAKESFREIKDRPKSEIFKLCEELLKSGYCEEAWIAASWAEKVRSYEKDDFEIFERWIEKYIDNWAECDTLCNHTIGSFIDQYPEYISRLKKWTQSKNRWVKRASAVTLIIPAKKGQFLKDIFEIADLLLLDSDDMVQKGYGWLLKEASRTHTKEVFDFVMQRKAKMPRTALRYAIEKMPHDLKTEAMKK